MSSKPDGTNGKKSQTKASVYKEKSDRGAQRYAKAIKDNAWHVRHMKVKRGAARALRRYNGDFNPVNTEASLKQHPDGEYARKVHGQKAKANFSQSVSKTEAAKYIDGAA